MRTVAFRAGALALLLGLGQAVSLAGPVVGWRNDGTGVFTSAAQAPVEWSAEKNVLWKVALPGMSYAAPVVVGEKLVVVSDPADVLCVSRKDGKVLWRKDVKDIKAPAGGGGGMRGGKGGGGGGGGGFGRSAGNSAATPVTDGQHVVTVFGNGVVAVYDLDGKRVWGKYVESSQVGFGHAASPVLAGGKVIVHFRNLVALDLATGKEAWKASLPPSHASPVPGKLGKYDVVISPAGAVVRVKDGKVLARGPFRSSDNSPVVVGDTIFVAGRGAFLMSGGDAEEDASVVRLWGAAAGASESGGGGGGGRGERRLPSPVVHGGLMYSVSTASILEVTDIKSGEQVYRQRLPLGQLYSSLALAGGNVYAFDTAGKAVVFKAGRKFERVATSSLEGTGACPVFADGQLFVRGTRNLYCVAAAKAKE